MDAVSGTLAEMLTSNPTGKLEIVDVTSVTAAGQLEIVAVTSVTDAGKLSTLTVPETMRAPLNDAVMSVGKFVIDAVTAFDIETGIVIEAVMLVSNPDGKFEIDAVSGIDPVMFTSDEPPVEPVTHRGAARVLVT